MRWHEFQLTFFEFPGQTLYHDGLLADRDGGEALFFTGDSFTPSGIDNYCLQNRDFVRDGEGYLYCLKILRGLPKKVWLVNQHVDPTFQFSDDQYTRMQAELLNQRAALAELAPWPDPNYAIDESWARIDPYGSEVRRRGECRTPPENPQSFAAPGNLPRRVELAGWVESRGGGPGNLHTGSRRAHPARGVDRDMETDCRSPRPT